jgi:hypothetical protein
MLTKDKVNSVNILILSYFVITFTELVAEYFSLRPMVLVTRIATPFLLMIIYKANSGKPNPMVFTLFGLLLMTNILFYYKDSPYFFLAVMISIVQRLVMLLIIFQSVVEKRNASFLVASLPFLIIFYYLNSITSEFTLIEFNTLFFQSILVSLLGGISLSGYLRNDNRQNSWLLISTLLFIGLQFVVFIERYFFTVISLRVFGLIGVVLNAFGFFTFYKFVNAAEKERKE